MLELLYYMESNKVYIVTKQGDEIIEKEEVTDVTSLKITTLSNEIASFNTRQWKLHEKGLIEKPLIKLLITN